MDENIPYENDVIDTNQGELKIYFFGHASLLFFFSNLYIYIDPFAEVADYSRLPKADLILITHEHSDHFDLSAINKIRIPQTNIILNENSARHMNNGTVMHNGDVLSSNAIKIRAVPAYNIVHKRGNGNPFHIKGDGNGYILTLGDKIIYIAGDTEMIPEMSLLQGISIAFLPMNLPYTMTPEMAAQAALSFKPEVLYPYHYGETNIKILKDLLKNQKEIEVRIKKM